MVNPGVGCQQSYVAMARRWTTKFRYMLLLVMMGVVVLPPLRMALKELVLPATWADTDSTHLYHVIHDFQDFPVDKYPIEHGSEWKIIKPNFTEFESYVKQRENAYPKFHRYFEFLKSQPQDDENIRKRTELISKFQPIMTPKESAELLFSLDIFIKACNAADLTFFILEASLMGAIRHHGFIPWDDDVDVVLSARQWQKARNVLGNIEGFELYTPADSQWKFYMKSSKSFPDKPFKFPNLDIFFYTEDETHIWALTKGLKHDLVYWKSDIFPLQMRPFENLIVPVPCNLDLVVHKAHDKTVCITPEYIHKTNENFYFHGQTSVHCKILYDIYPFVVTVPSRKPGYDEEYLKLGAEVIHKKTLPRGCHR